MTDRDALAGRARLAEVLREAALWRGEQLSRSDSERQADMFLAADWMTSGCPDDD